MSTAERPRQGEACDEFGRSDQRDAYEEYIADMILELQQMAAKSGRHKLAERLKAAYQVARE